MAEIKINPDVWESVSKELKTQGENISAASKQFEDAINILRTVWTGHTATTILENNNIKVNLEGYVKRLNEIAEAFQWKAEEFRISDQQG